MNIVLLVLLFMDGYVDADWVTWDSIHSNNECQEINQIKQENLKWLEDNPLVGVDKVSGFAIKVIDDYHEFLRELKMHQFVRKKKIQGIVPIHCYLVENHAILMKGINGYEAHAFVAQKRQRDPDAAFKFILDIGEKIENVMNELHKVNVHFLDIKPENILIDPNDDSVWMIDLGKLMVINDEENAWKKYQYKGTAAYFGSGYIQLLERIVSPSNTNDMDFTTAQALAKSGDKMALARTMWVLWFYAYSENDESIVYKQHLKYFHNWIMTRGQEMRKYVDMIKFLSTAKFMDTIMIWVMCQIKINDLTEIESKIYNFIKKLTKFDELSTKCDELSNLVGFSNKEYSINIEELNFEKFQCDERKCTSVYRDSSSNVYGMTTFFSRDVFDEELKRLKQYQLVEQKITNIERLRVIPIYGYSSPTQSILMKHIEGIEVDKYVETFEDLQLVIRQIETTMNELHSHEIYYLDIKPEKILIEKLQDKEDVVWISDLELSMIIDSEHNEWRTYKYMGSKPQYFGSGYIQLLKGINKQDIEQEKAKQLAISGDKMALVKMTVSLWFKIRGQQDPFPDFRNPIKDTQQFCGLAKQMDLKVMSLFSRNPQDVTELNGSELSIYTMVKILVDDELSKFVMVDDEGNEQECNIDIQSLRLDNSKCQKDAKGGFGCVSLWRDTDGNIYAIKTIYNTKSFDAELKAHKLVRNIQEIKNMNVVPMYCYSYSRQGILMKGIKGTQFNKFVAAYQDGTPIFTFIEKVIEEIEKIMNALHENGIYYLDLKPENILIDQDRIVWMVDLGLWMVIDNEHNEWKNNKYVGTTDYLGSGYLELLRDSSNIHYTTAKELARQGDQMALARIIAVIWFHVYKFKRIEPVSRIYSEYLLPFMQSLHAASIPKDTKFEELIEMIYQKGKGIDQRIISMCDISNILEGSESKIFSLMQRLIGDECQSDKENQENIPSMDTNKMNHKPQVMDPKNSGQERNDKPQVMAPRNSGLVLRERN